MINIYSQNWVFKIVPGHYEQEGITIWPFIFYTCTKEALTEPLRRHEEYHWRHQLKWLVIPWYIVYWILRLKYGYWNHPWEELARRAE